MIAHVAPHRSGSTTSAIETQNRRKVVAMFRVASRLRVRLRKALNSRGVCARVVENVIHHLIRKSASCALRRWSRICDLRSSWRDGTARSRCRSAASLSRLACGNLTVLHLSSEYRRRFHGDVSPDLRTTTANEQRGYVHGLEGTADRRSFGRHGDQHVRLRQAQVSRSARAACRASIRKSPVAAIAAGDFLCRSPDCSDHRGAIYSFGR